MKQTERYPEFYEQLRSTKLMPLYTTTDMKYLDKLEEILLETNIKFVEVTYRSDLANETIKYLADKGNLVVGAGTVRTLKDAHEAVANGAEFIVTPGLVEDVVKYCNEIGLPILPGAATPTEILTAQSYGIDVVKFFPADVYGGWKAIKSLSGPFYDVQFMPTGGVNAENLHEYLAINSVIGAGGSFIISEKAIAEDNGVSAKAALKQITASINN